jgi:hypothetical protein
MKKLGEKFFVLGVFWGKAQGRTTDFLKAQDARLLRKARTCDNIGNY